MQTEPKRKHRWLLYLGGTDIPVFVVKTVKKPGFTINPAEHQFFGHKFYYPGKTTWNPIQAVIVDTTDPSLNATQAIMKVLEESGYDLPTTPTVVTGFGTVSKDKAVNAALGQVRIKTLDGSGDIVEEWVLNNAFLTKAEVQMGKPMILVSEVLCILFLKEMYARKFSDCKVLV